MVVQQWFRVGGGDQRSVILRFTGYLPRFRFPFSAFHFRFFGRFLVINFGYFSGDRAIPIFTYKDGGHLRQGSSSATLIRHSS